MSSRYSTQISPTLDFQPPKQYNPRMSDIKDLQEKIIKFRDQRNWKQFHNPKDVSLSMVLEATEIMEHFQWKNEKEMQEHIKKNKKEISKELADVFYWALLMGHDLGIDLKKAVETKMKENKKKYPVGKAKNKPISLLNGGNLLSMLQKHGYAGKIDLNEAKEMLNQ